MTAPRDGLTPIPVGLLVNRLVSERVTAMVDEYGQLCADPAADARRRDRLAALLRAILRTLRVEAASGARYRLVRIGDALRMQRHAPP